VLPPRWRRELLALYGFARLVDEAGDTAGDAAADTTGEATRDTTGDAVAAGAAGERLALLEAIEADLLRLFAGGEAAHPLLQALQPLIERGALRAEPLQRLIEANRRDQVVTRYATWAELLDYCAHSANPVGECVLGLAGADSPERLAWSDAICSALQVIEHCQDVVEDHRSGRIYLPAEDLAWADCEEADLERRPATPALRRVLRRCGERARELLHRGAPLPGTLRGPARLAVAAFIGGGHAALDALERADYDVTGGAAGVQAGRAARLGAALRAWRRVR
jgi:squalene synthase HpnC